MFVYLNKFVIFHMCGEEKAMVAHFVLFSVFLVGGGVVILCCMLFCVVFVVSVFVVGLLESCLMWLCGVWFSIPFVGGCG